MRGSDFFGLMRPSPCPFQWRGHAEDVFSAGIKREEGQKKNPLGPQEERRGDWVRGKNQRTRRIRYYQIGLDAGHSRFDHKRVVTSTIVFQAGPLRTQVLRPRPTPLPFPTPGERRGFYSLPPFS